jgi:hypothetical protein
MPLGKVHGNTNTGFAHVGIVPQHAWVRATIAAVLSGCFGSAPPGGGVRGTVRYGNAVLPGALVSLAAGASTRSQVTGADGTYLFGDLAPGTYALTATSERWSVEGAVAVTAQVARTVVTAADATLTPAGALAGTLVQSPAIDLTGAVVTAGPLTALADANGAFDFGRVPAADYAITAVGPNRVTAQPIDAVVGVEQLTQVLIPLLTEQAPPPHINHPPQVGAIEVTPVVATASNPSPVLLVPDLPPNQTPPGGSLHLRCPASDPDGDPLTMTWQVSGGLVAAAGADAIDWTAAATAATISCLVSDGQGGVASAVLAVSVFDFNYIGAALSASTLVAARTNATQGSSDLFLLDRASAVVAQLATPANESAPQLAGSMLAYLSDENATAENPLDVYLRSPPSAAATRLTTAAGAEIFSLTSAAVYVANGATLTRYANGQATPILPNGGNAVAPGAVIDRVVAGSATVMFRQTSTTASEWSGVRSSDGSIFALALAATAAVAWDGNRYLAADPMSQQVIAFPDALPVLAPVLLAALPPLSGAPFPTVAGDSSGFAFAAFDDTGLFTPLTFVSTPLAVTAPAAALAVANGAVLFGTPAGTELPPTRALWLWQP